MKRFLAIILAGLMLLSLAACGAKEDETSNTYARLTAYVNGEKIINHIIKEHPEIPSNTSTKPLQYDSLNSALMGLKSGKAAGLLVDNMTGKYIAAHNSEFAYSEAKAAHKIDYLMMTMDTKKEVYDILNNAIKDMKADGTLDALIENELKAYIESDPVAKDLPHFDGAKTIKIGVTGDLPPMDFVASNGKAAGFNIALLTEIANRAQVNFELVQIETGARAISLSSGNVDAIFWTSNYVCPTCGEVWSEEVEGTIVTESYFSSEFGSITLKSDK